MRFGEKVDIDDGVVLVLGICALVAFTVPVSMYMHNQRQEALEKSQNERELGFAKAGLSKLGNDVWVKVHSAEIKAEVSR